MYESFEPDYSEKAIAYAAIIDKLELLKNDTAQKRSRRARYYILTHFDADDVAQIFRQHEILTEDIYRNGGGQIVVKASDIKALGVDTDSVGLLLGLLGCAPTVDDSETWSNNARPQDARQFKPSFARF